MKQSALYYEHKRYALERLGGCCTRCGISDDRVLDFDHRYPKEKRYCVSALFMKRDPQPMLDQELELCQLLCANCHRIKSKENNDPAVGRSHRKKYKTYYWKHREEILAKARKEREDRRRRLSQVGQYTKRR